MFFILFYCLLLLYDCSGYSGYFNSGYFNSFNFNSNNFNSGKLHYSSHMLTMIPSSYSQMVSLNTLYSSHMLTMIPSSYSQMVSLNTIFSVSSSPLATLKPTPLATLSPTTTFRYVLSFTSDIGLSNVKTVELDLAAQESVIGAQALTMNISSDDITFVSSSVSKNSNLMIFKPTKNLIRSADSHSSWSMTDKDLNPSPKGADLNLYRFKLSSYNLLVTTKTVIIVNGEDPNIIFESLTSILNNAVTSGAFTQNLVEISVKLNSSATASASISSVTNSAPIIISPTPLATLSPSIQNEESKIVKKYNGKWIIIFVSCISVIVFLNIVYEVYARMRRKQNRSLDIAEIGIQIVR